MRLYQAYVYTWTSVGGGDDESERLHISVAVIPCYLLWIIPCNWVRFRVLLVGGHTQAPTVVHDRFLFSLGLWPRAAAVTCRCGDGGPWEIVSQVHFGASLTEQPLAICRYGAGATARPNSSGISVRLNFGGIGACMNVTAEGSEPAWSYYWRPALDVHAAGCYTNQSFLLPPS